MTFGRSAALVPAIVLGLALGGAAPAAENRTAENGSGGKVENRGHRMLKDADPREKRRVLGQLVGAKGHNCRAWDVAFKDLQDGRSYWVTKCMSGRDFLVMIRPDEKGTSEVWSCKAARKKGKPCDSDW